MTNVAVSSASLHPWLSNRCYGLVGSSRATLRSQNVDVETALRNEIPSRKEIDAQLCRILKSASFCKSERLQKFLQYIVEETLCGRAESLKEYTLALDVFQRDESFDPQTSSIVRVEASRLRGKLEKYNAIDGCEDPICISLPAGTYVPVFRFNVRKPQSRSIELAPTDSGERVKIRRRQAVALGLGLLLLLGIEASLFLTLLPQTEESSARSLVPAVAVLPLRNLTGDSNQDYVSEGVTDALTFGLAKNGRLHVISKTSAMSYRNTHKPITDIAGELNVSHIVEGSVQRIGDRFQITAQLIDTVTDRTLWSESFALDREDVINGQDDVVERIETFLIGSVIP